MTVLPQLVNGVALGAGYAALAIGWTVLLGAARLVNFAHGQLYMVGAFLTWWLTAPLGLPFLAAIPIVVAGGGLLGLVMQLLMTRLTLEQNVVSLMLVTLAFGYVLQGSVGLVAGGDPRVIPSPFEAQTIRVGGSQLSVQDAALVVVVVALYFALWLVLTRTRTGRIVRAVTEDPKLAQLFGLDAAKVYQGIFVFEAATVAFAGLALAPRAPILPSIGFDELIITFVVVVLGGIGNIWGNFAVAFALGIFIAVVGAFVPTAFSTAIAFGVLLVFLVVRPEGLTAR